MTTDVSTITPETGLPAGAVVLIAKPSPSDPSKRVFDLVLASAFQGPPGPSGSVNGAGGISGQVQININGALSGITIGGDAVLNPNTGALTVLKIGGATVAPVATSGSYTDLSNRPILGSAAALNVGTVPGSLAAADDPRLVNSIQRIGGTTGAALVPVGTSAQQPDTGNVGEIRFNGTTGRWEFGVGGSWVNFARLTGDTLTGALNLVTGSTVVSPAPTDNSTNIVNSFWVRNYTASLPPGTAVGQVAFFNGSNWATLSPGTAGYVLVSGGAGSNPSWGAPPAGTASAAGSLGQVQVAGAGGQLAAITISGDATLNGSTGALTLANKGAASGPVISDSRNKVPLNQLPASNQVTIDGSVITATLATPYQMGANDFRVWVNKVGRPAATYVNLPTAPVLGETYIITDILGDFDSNPCTISAGSNSIEGTPTIVINDRYGTLAVVAGPGNAWRIV